MRAFLFLLLAVLSRAQNLDDAVRSIAKDVTAQLSPGEIAHVSERSIDPAFAEETTRARMLLDRALRRPTPRGATTVEVTVTATTNLRGPLLVIEIQKGPEPIVEMSGYNVQPAVRAVRPALT